MLKTIFEIVKSYSEIKSQYDFMDWFLGDQTDYTNAMLKYLYNEEREIGWEKKKDILREAKWNFSSFSDLGRFKEEMRKLYKDIFNDSEREINLDQMMKEFLKQYLFGTIYLDKILERYTGKVCQNHIYNKKHIEFFEKAWESSNIVVVYGKGGIGKTQLVKSYLQVNEEHYKEICFEDDYKSMEEALLGIPFLVNNKKNIGEIIYILKEKNKDSIIAIDIPELTDKDVELVKKYLLGLELRIIIISHQRLPLENIYQEEIVALDDETLRKIFDINVKKIFEMSEEEFKKLLDIVDRNTLVIALLGKCLGKKNANISKDVLLNEEEWLWNKTKLQRVNASEYKHKEDKTPIHHIIAILDKYGVMDKEYQEMAIWCKNAMSIDGLRKWCGFSEGIGYRIPEAYRKGIVEYEDSDKKIIKMHSLIADAIWKFYPIKYRKYKYNIENFLDNINWGKERILSYNMLYNGMYNCVQRFAFEISKEIDKKQRDNSIVDKYQRDLRRMIDFSIQAGNYYGAERLLYFWDKLFDDERYKRDLWEYELSLINENRENILMLGNKYEPFLEKEIELYTFSEFLRMKMDISVRKIRFLECQRVVSNCLEDGSLQSASDKSRESGINTLQAVVERFTQLLYSYKKVVGLNSDISWDPYMNYYIIVLKIVNGELQLEEVEQIVKYMKSLDIVGLPELKIKTQLEIAYWTMLYLIYNGINKEEIRKVIDEFEILKKEYQNKIWPFDVEILLIEVEVLKSALGQNLDIFCENIKKLSSIFEERVEMKETSYEVKKIQEVVPEVIEHIKNSHF